MKGWLIWMLGFLTLAGCHGTVREKLLNGMEGKIMAWNQLVEENQTIFENGFLQQEKLYQAIRDSFYTAIQRDSSTSRELRDWLKAREEFYQLGRRTTLEARSFIGQTTSWLEGARSNGLSGGTVKETWENREREWEGIRAKQVKVELKAKILSEKLGEIRLKGKLLSLKKASVWLPPSYPATN